MRSLVCLVWLIGLPLLGSAQVHLAPPQRGPGLPGPEAGSFLIVWGAEPGAVAYEYVMSDNPQCFAGCTGDTRQQIVRDTFAIEYGLREGRNYYWITRIHYADGVQSPWTLISAFRAETPAALPLLRVGPNPLYEGPLQLHIDWASDRRWTRLELALLDLQGRPLGITHSPRRQHPLWRLQEARWTLPPLPPGSYVLQYRPQSGGETGRPQSLRLVVR
ncbi:MAG: hypothetical protein D6722_22725 [Bacteroidetes bacterium]|nr:MAG: hypothetical protein D6722_22725 [Bacteroidota bacterium]